MFRKGSIEDPDLTLVYNTADLWEAQVAKGLLEKEGIPVILMDREDSGDYLRIIGCGSPFGIDVYVNKAYADSARRLINNTLDRVSDITEEELAELAMQAKPEDDDPDINPDHDPDADPDV